MLSLGFQERLSPTVACINTAICYPFATFFAPAKVLVEIPSAGLMRGSNKNSTPKAVELFVTNAANEVASKAKKKEKSRRGCHLVVVVVVVGGGGGGPPPPPPSSSSSSSCSSSLLLLPLPRQECSLKPPTHETIDAREHYVHRPAGDCIEVFLPSSQTTP